MKLRAIIRETSGLKEGDFPQSLIVEFVKDKKKQHFEVLFYDLDPYREGIRKFDIWELTIRLESELFTHPKTRVKSYFTTLVCSKATPVNQPQE